MKMTLTNKTDYDLTDNEAQQIMQLVDRGAKFIKLRGDLIMASAILAIQDIPAEKPDIVRYYLDDNNLPAPEVPATSEEIAKAKTKLISKLGIINTN